MDKDISFMKEALVEAKRAAYLEEVPIGAVVVREGEIIGRGHNRRETDQDPTAHAEVIAIRGAAENISAWRLSGAEVYVTIEPCSMCAGALVLARVERVIIGAMDPKAGAGGSVLNILQHEALNHQVKITRGILEKECSSILQDFFLQKR